MDQSETCITFLHLLVILFSLSTLRVSITSVTSLNPNCECIVFDNTFGKEYGVFHSPNWPIPYEDNLECLLYTFLAPSDHIVEITFDEFDVQKTNLDCVFGDYVRLFLHLSEVGVNEDSQWNSILCGKIADIDQIHYSSDSALIFEFHSDWRQANNTGFRGTFRFLSKQLFQTDGELLPKTRCDFNFESHRVDDSSGQKVTRRKGRFYSPHYPSTYPKNIVCSYHFAGESNERIQLVLEHVRLQKDDLSCLSSLDVIYVYDGNDKTFPVIGQICNTNNFVELISTGPDLYVEFHSKSHIPGQGFKGRYSFDTIGTQKANNNIAHIHSNEIGMPSEERLTRSSVPTIYPVFECDEWLSSDKSMNGSFSTPNYPDTYPGDIHCSFHFNGRGKERVQILFAEFDLYKSDDSIRDCDTADTVMVFITINGQKERIDNYCGKELPPQIMSNGPSMIVEFKSLNSPDRVKGFSAFYKFVTNFGITQGVQDQQAVCGFNFTSTERGNGTFTSPNYPGLYPRDTECHYFFFGNTSEKVHITFSYFDVEGVTPCTAETASDYVEFSNYRTVDRKIPRHCGLKQPKVIESDGDFFRITFKSNDRFDGTGFEAFYQFRSIEESFTVKKVRISGCVRHRSKLWPIICIVMLILNIKWTWI